MCGLYAYNKENDRSTYATNFVGGRPIPDYSTLISLVSLCVSIKFIDTWLNALAKTLAWRCCDYQENMKETIKRITTKIPKPTTEYFKKKRLTILTDIGGE